MAAIGMTNITFSVRMKVGGIRADYCGSTTAVLPKEYKAEARAINPASPIKSPEYF